MTKREIVQSAGLVIALLAVIGGIMLFALQPKLEAVQAARLRQRETAITVDQTRERLTYLQEASAQRDEITALKNSAVVYLPGEPDENTFVAQLGDIAAQRGVTLRSLTLDKDKATTLATKYQVSGSYQPLLGFINNLHTMLRAARVSSLTFKSVETGVHLDIVGIIYYSPLPANLVSVNQQLSQEAQKLSDRIRFGSEIKSTDSPAGSAEPFGTL